MPRRGQSEAACSSLGDDRWRPEASRESLIALHSWRAGTVESRLSKPVRGFAFRPIAVAEPFEPREEWCFELARIAADLGAHLHQRPLAEVDAAAMGVRALEAADAKLSGSTYALALKRFDAGEDVVGPLPMARQAQPEEPIQQRVHANR
jgi:hypothetical protein